MLFKLNDPDKFWLKFSWVFGLWSTFRWSGLFSHWEFKGKTYTRKRIKFLSTNKMHKEIMPLTAFWNSNELPYLVTLHLNVLNFGGHILNLAYQRCHLPSIHLLALSLYIWELHRYVILTQKIVSATTIQHILVKGVALFCVSGQVIELFLAHGRVLGPFKDNFKG